MPSDTNENPTTENPAPESDVGKEQAAPTGTATSTEAEKSDAPESGTSGSTSQTEQVSASAAASQTVSESAADDGVASGVDSVNAANGEGTEANAGVSQALPGNAPGPAAMTSASPAGPNGAPQAQTGAKSHVHATAMPKIDAFLRKIRQDIEKIIIDAGKLEHWADAELLTVLHHATAKSVGNAPQKVAADLAKTNLDAKAAAKK